MRVHIYCSIITILVILGDNGRAKSDGSLSTNGEDVGDRKEGIENTKSETGNIKNEQKKVLTFGDVTCYENESQSPQSTPPMMGSIQLGIKLAIDASKGLTGVDLKTEDYSTIETVNFPAKGSTKTPSHTFPYFSFQIYAPIAFRNFRDVFEIQSDAFSESLCKYPLRELSNPAASGSLFYLTEDDEFIIKTVQNKEATFLQALLPGYKDHLKENPHTLLPKYYGLYCYQTFFKNIKFVVMNNLLPSSIKFHEKYDLKGSTLNRNASKSERQKKLPTYRDLNFIEEHPTGIILEDTIYDQLVSTIQRDTDILKSFNIMDYSLLVGVYNLDLALKAKSGVLRQISRNKVAILSTPAECIKATGKCPTNYDKLDLPPGGIFAKNGREETLYLFIGIIDILQSFGLRKQLEHTCKSIFHDSETISVQEPEFYAQRFQNFITETVFKKASATDIQHNERAIIHET